MSRTATIRSRPCDLCGDGTRARWDLEAVELHGRADLAGRPVCGVCREQLSQKGRRDLHPERKSA